MQEESINEILKLGIVEITFTKVSGESRTCKATLKSDLLPEENKSTSSKPRAKNPNVIAFYSIDDQGWRSCKLDSITSYQMISYQAS